MKKLLLLLLVFISPSCFSQSNEINIVPQPVEIKYNRIDQFDALKSTQIMVQIKIK